MDQTIAHYTQLKSLGVDLTQYIINEASLPEKVTKIVAGGVKPVPQVHLYMGGASHNLQQ